MKLVSFQLRNYKSFADSGVLHFGNGFNVIVGQNNAGKSSLLQGIGLRFSDNAHRSLKTKPTPTTPLSPQSETLFSVACDGKELRDILINQGQQFRIPTPDGTQGNQDDAIKILDGLFSSQRIDFPLRRSGNGQIEVTKIPSFSDYASNQPDMIVQPGADRSGFVLAGRVNAGDRHTELGALVGHEFLKQLYFFQAERLSLAERAFGTSQVLSQDARNLPEVLNVLQANAARFARFNQHVKQIFPTVHQVAVRPNPNSGLLEIVIWTVDPGTEREDLAISLADSGTGVGQILAILYVAITSSYPRMIVIDEPNSFLNPGAAKKLIEILRSFKHLQFIISTHSPEIVVATQPQTLSVIQWSDGVSTVEQMDPGNISGLQRVLREVGASLSDVFGADRVLWVEGPTEEICFRLIIQRCLKRPLIGTAIAAVRDLGRLTSQKPSANLVWEIYTKLSAAGALMPPALVFSFDRDGRTEIEITDIKRRSDGRVHFLPRRMLENYLLDAEAITAVLSSEMNADQAIAADTIRTWISGYLNKHSLVEDRGAATDTTTWLAAVDGARLLDQLFAEISYNTVVFDKVRHGPMLTEWLIDHRPEALAELRDYIDGLTQIGG